jgi:hypothetical protein
LAAVDWRVAAVDRAASDDDLSAFLVNHVFLINLNVFLINANVFVINLHVYLINLNVFLFDLNVFLIKLNPVAAVDWRVAAVDRAASDDDLSAPPVNHIHGCVPNREHLERF